MTLPRALRGPVFGMARPRRPAAEVRAVREAAAAIRVEMGLTSAKALGREIAKRVTERMLTDAEVDPSEAILSAFADHDPIVVLASSPVVGTAEEFSNRFHERMRVFGSFIPPLFQQQVQRRSAAEEFSRTLSERYARHLCA